MVDGRSDATALLGMDGFVVRSMELIDDEWWLLVETMVDVVGSSSYGVGGHWTWAEPGSGSRRSDRRPSGPARLDQAPVAVS